jgi:antirestriction protein ArdC
MSSTAPKRDHRQEVTDSIIKMLEEGTSPWQKPWTAGAMEMPFNPITGKAYRGGNAVHLLAAGMAAGADDPRWMTYKQAQQRGWQVKKGEKGTQIEYWEFPERDAATLRRDRNSNGNSDVNPTEKETDQPRLIHRIYTVFNAKQIEGMPAHGKKQPQEFEVLQAGETILANSGAKIDHDQTDRAFYDRRADGIHLPAKASFKSAGDYYGTALHELAHWSGHPSRLNRNTLNDSRGFGDESYAREELRAELTSVFLAAERGIPHDPANHAAYVGSWIKALRDDKNEIFKAAKDAHRAADFLFALEREQSVEKALQAIQNPQHRRETTEYVAEFEPGTGTVNIENKATSREERTIAAINGKSADSLAEPKRTTEQVLDNQVHPDRPDLQDLKRSFAAAQELSKKELGPSSKTYVAQTDSGVYHGEIIGETDLHVIQRLNGKSVVAHMKHTLGSVPDVGEQVLITYSHGNGRSQAMPVRARDKELAR